MSTSPRPQKRTASTCVTCRHRKVRCDGRRDICTNCERLGFTCSYEDGFGVESTQPDGHSHSHGAIAVPRRRVRQACLNCHSKKARCSGSVPQCDRCRLQGLECVYRPGKRSMPLPSSASVTSDTLMRDESEPGVGYDQTYVQGSASPSAAGFDPPEPDEALAKRAFESYFKHVHHIPIFSFLHRASLMERYHAGTLDRSLLLAIIGITTLFSDMGPGMDEYGERCIDEAAALCLAELERPSILRLQALVLVVKHRILSKRFSSAFMLHAIASRSATALRLNHENPSLCFLARESRRRLMWSIYMIDSALAGGQADFALWPDAEHQIHIQLPCNERHFDFDLPETTEPLRAPLDLQGMVTPMPDVVGFMALYVRIHWIRTRILHFVIKAASTPTLEELATLATRCAGLTAELEAFEARMPLSFRWSESNLRLRTYSPRLGIFLMTHVWWRQCHLDLYRMFLPGLKEALPHSALAQLDPHMVAQYRRSCYEHAKAMADMFAQLVAPGNGSPVPGTPITDIDLPGCAYQCVRVLYHGLLTAADETGFTPDRVRGLANECLRAARQSTVGPACASIQSDVEKLIAEGLQLVPSYVSEFMSASMDDSGINTPQRPHASCSHTATSGVDSLAMTMSMVSSASMLTMAPVAASNASGGTSGSNAFEESLDAFSFGGPDLTGPESWAGFSLSNEWLDMGHLGDGGG